MVEPACAKADATTALEELTALLCLAERMGRASRPRRPPPRWRVCGSPLMTAASPGNP